MGLLQELKFIRRVGPVQYEIAPGFVPHMRVPGTCYVNTDLEGLIFDELKAFCNSGGHGGFLPAVKQLANVAALPGIVQVRRTPPRCCTIACQGVVATCMASCVLFIKAAVP